MSTTDQSNVDPSVLVTVWKLEAMSERLLAFGQRADQHVDVAARAFELRAGLDGHLLAVRLLRSSGASADSVSNVISRALDMFDEALKLLTSSAAARDR